jgi:phosphatidate cytidylyltransferase
MALNKQTFVTRTITAIVFAAVMLLGLLWNHWSFFILFSIIHFGCWWEYLKLAEKIYKTTFHIYTKLGWVLMGYGIMLLFCGPAYMVSGYGLKENLSLPVSAAGFVLLIAGIFKSHLIRTKAMLMAALGVVYISVSWGLMIDLGAWALNYETHTEGKFISEPGGLTVFGVLPLFIIFSIWINDTMAYIVGSQIGKTPLSKISPKKTWEGTAGGTILAVVVMTWLGSQYFNLSIQNAVAIAAIAAITGTFGDLLESKLKRMAGVKDSGSIMPGHGGFLDRFDSLLLAIPAVWLFAKFFMN